jgi:acyl-CoA reductase-like NAD-dependent aldehyde dehydrogenase
MANTITMDGNDPVHATYSLMAKRETASSMAACRIARDAIPSANGVQRLALLEAVTDAISNLLRDIGDHRLQNQALWGVKLADLDIQALADECAAAWEQVLRLRGEGLNSEALIRPYVGNWMDPIGSPDWLSRMARGVPRRQEPKWIARMKKSLSEEDEEDDEE